MKSTHNLTRLTALAAAITTALYAGNAAAIQRQIHAAVVVPGGSDNFTMFSAFGLSVGGTNQVATTWDGTVFTDPSDYTGPGSKANVTVASTTAFFGYTWTAHNIQMFAPGSYSFDTAQGGGNPETGILKVTVPANRLGMHMLFDWNGNLNIDVFIVLAPNSPFGAGIGRSTTFNATNATFACDTSTKNCLWDGLDRGPDGKPAGSKVWMLSSLDGNADGIMGIPMAAGGPFAGFNANFNFAGTIIAGGLAPLVIDDTVIAINVNGSASNIPILANDVDIDNGNVNLGVITPAQLKGGTAASGITIANQTGGTATVNADGTVTWTNTSGTTGTNSFTYTLTDASNNVSAPAKVTIPVGVGIPPVANPDTLSATEDTPLTINKASDLLANDTDADTAHNLLTLNSFTQPSLGQGTITDQGTTLLYKPATLFHGPATFTYTIIDTNSNVSNAATVTINVAAVNHPPVAQNDSSTTTLNAPVTINVLANDSDVDGNVLTVTSTSTPTSGSVTINANNTVTYTPKSGFSGSDSFTYTISDGKGGTATATVSVTVLGALGYIGTAVPNTTTSSAITGGSNFTMLDGNGADVGGTNDISVSWDGTLKNNVADTTPNMLLASAKPTPFFGFTWNAHDVRVFGPGTYTFEACPPGDGSTRCTFPDPLTMTVGPTQVGMHMLFDWGQPGANTPCGLANCNIDVVQVVELDKAFAGATDKSNNLGASGAVFSMASVDGNGDGIPGIPMVDGAFIGFNANFNLNLTPQLALPVATAVASQGGNPTSVIVPSGGPVTITATAPAGATFDWNSTLLGKQTDAALVAVNTNGSTSQTFVFNPSMLTNGPVTARVTIRDPSKGNLANYAVVPMVVSASTSLANAADANNNGIPDVKDSGLPATELPAVAGNGSSYLVQSSAGALRLGQTAATVGAGAGSYAAGVTAASIGVADTGVATACVGGCFDYQVTGLTKGASINVVLPLSAAIPANAVARKFANGEWRNFSLLGGDALASAPGGPGTCPAPGNTAYRSGLNVGDFCVQVTITDGGRNDADSTANGTISDPIGLGSSAATTGGGVISVGNPSTGGSGGCTVSTTTDANQRLDLWLLGALLTWLGLRRKAQQ